MPNFSIEVSNLPKDVTSSEIDEIFFKFGKIKKIKINNTKATVTFTKQQSADEAKSSRDGFVYDGFTLGVVGVRNKNNSSQQGSRITNYNPEESSIHTGANLKITGFFQV